jgi:hypothetical protein
MTFAARLDANLTVLGASAVVARVARRARPVGIDSGSRAIDLVVPAPGVARAC